jgi:hypothetical protein
MLESMGANLHLQLGASRAGTAAAALPGMAWAIRKRGHGGRAWGTQEGSRAGGPPRSPPPRNPAAKTSPPSPHPHSYLPSLTTPST